MKTVLPEGWREHSTNQVVFPHADRFYQKKIFSDGDDEVFAEIVEISRVFPRKW